MDVDNGDERFTAADLADLRTELQGEGLDSWQAAELVTAFLIARGYGVSTRDARSAVARIESRSCSIECMQQELGRLALVM